VNFLDFLLHITPLVALNLAIHRFLKQHGLLRPANSPVICWETALFQVVRWPWAAYGSLMGIVMAIRQRHVEFRVTPKGGSVSSSLSWKVLSPYMGCLAITYAPALLVEDAGPARGYFFFLILSQIVYLAALISIVLIHRREVQRSSG
jgi:cellulose synthase (UDP-forming)